MDYLRREKTPKFRETGNLKHLYENEFNKVHFAHDSAYSDIKDLAVRTISGKILKDRAFELLEFVYMIDIKGN